MKNEVLAKCLRLYNNVLSKTTKLSGRSAIYTRQIWDKILTAHCEVWAVLRRTAPIPWALLFCVANTFVSFKRGAKARVLLSILGIRMISVFSVSSMSISAPKISNWFRVHENQKVKRLLVTVREYNSGTWSNGIFKFTLIWDKLINVVLKCDENNDISMD